MDHLKTYDEKNIIQDIKDICLELQDEGFIVEYHMEKRLNYDFLSSIKIHKFRNKTFNYNETLETIERLKDFMESEGYITRIENTTRKGLHPFYLLITITFIRK